MASVAVVAELGEGLVQIAGAQGGAIQGHHAGGIVDARVLQGAAQGGVGVDVISNLLKVVTDSHTDHIMYSLSFKKFFVVKLVFGENPHRGRAPAGFMGRSGSGDGDFAQHLGLLGGDLGQSTVDLRLDLVQQGDGHADLLGGVLLGVGSAGGDGQGDGGQLGRIVGAGSEARAVLVDGAVALGGADGEDLLALALVIGLIQAQSLGAVLLQGLDVLQGLGAGDDHSVADDSDLCHSVTSFLSG